MFQNPKKVEMILFILFLLPGTPKDLLVYIAGLLPIKPSRFIIISTLARIPSIVSSTYAALKRGRVASFSFFNTSLINLAGALPVLESMIEVEPLPGKISVNKGFIVATPDGTLDDDVVVNSDELVRVLKEKIQEHISKNKGLISSAYSLYNKKICRI